MGLKEHALEAIDAYDWQDDILQRLSILGVSSNGVIFDGDCESAIVDGVWHGEQLIEGLLFSLPPSGPGLDAISMDDDGESRWLGTVHRLLEMGLALAEAQIKAPLRPEPKHTRSGCSISGGCNVAR